MTRPSLTEYSYRPEIDGLRAISVLSVFFFHAGLPGFSGGYLGVDVFFVISGYLITGISLKEQALGRFTVGHFYEKRFRRLMPALAFVLFLSFLASFFFLLPYEFKYFSQSLVSTVGFASNVFSYFKQGYFDASNEIKPLLHTWSLSLEEQFYFLFPWLIYLFRKPGRLLSILSGFFGLSLILTIAKCAPGSAFNFFLLPMRAWELLSGSLLAYFEIREKPIPILNAIPNGLAMLLLGGSIYFFNSNTPHPGPLTLIPVLSAVTLLQFRRKGDIIHRLLSSEPWVMLGLFSYSFYLFHQPVLVLMRTYLGRELIPIDQFGALLVSLLLGYSCWRWVEKPFRRITIRENPNHFLLTLGLLVALGAAGVYGHLRHGLPERTLFYRPSGFFNVFSSTDHQKVIAKKCGDPSRVCQIHSLGDSHFSRSGLLLIGDSHAQDYLEPFLKFAQDSQRNAWWLSVGGCSFVARDVASDCKAAKESLVSFLPDHPSLQIIWVENLENHTRGDRDAQKRFGDFVLSLGQNSMKLTFFKPRNQFETPVFLWGTSPRIDLRGDFPIRSSDKTWERIYSKIKSDQLFDERSELCKISSSNRCSPLEAETLLPLYRDDNHLTPYGANLIFERFLKTVR